MRRAAQAATDTSKSGARLCFGHDVVRHLDAAGELVPADRTIHKVEASAVRRIFKVSIEDRS